MSNGEQILAMVLGERDDRGEAWINAHPERWASVVELIETVVEGNDSDERMAALDSITEVIDTPEGLYRGEAL